MHSRCKHPGGPSTGPQNRKNITASQRHFVFMLQNEVPKWALQNWKFQPFCGFVLQNDALSFSSFWVRGLVRGSSKLCQFWPKGHPNSFPISNGYLRHMTEAVRLAILQAGQTIRYSLLQYSPKPVDTASVNHPISTQIPWCYMFYVCLSTQIPWRNIACNIFLSQPKSHDVTCSIYIYTHTYISTPSSTHSYRWTLKAGPMVLKYVFLHRTPWSRLSQKKQDPDYETQWKRFNAYGL